MHGLQLLGCGLVLRVLLRLGRSTWEETPEAMLGRVAHSCDCDLGHE